MGLDLVELTIGIEEAFGISIPDEEAAQLETPRQVINYLEAHLLPAAEAGCLSQQAFYSVRAELMQQLSLPRSAIRPEVHWDSVLPKSKRNANWERLWRALGVRRWPSLRRPAPLAFGLAGAVIGFAALLWWADPNYPLVGFVSFLAAIGFGLLGMQATRRYCTVIPAHVATIGQTAQFLAVHAPTSIKRPNKGWTREEIKMVVIQLIQHHLDITEFDLDAHFVRDLGAD